jgi:hypothetical protein
MNYRSVAASAAVAACAILAAAAAQAGGTTTVAGTTDIFLASQPPGATVTGFFGSDTAPGNSPVGLSVGAGSSQTFSVTGTTSVDDSCFADADGGCYPNQSSFSPPPASGLYNGPADALIGIYLPAGTTDILTGSPYLDYTDPSNLGLASYSPGLNQIFIIGDGLTGDGTGATQTFFAPAGATMLYIASADSIGGSTGNEGALQVTFTGATLVSGAVPEPATWAMMLVGFGGVGMMLRSRTRRQLA